MENISWIDRLKSRGGKEYPTYNKGRKGTCICHILHRNCLQEHVTEGKTEELAGRRGRRRKQLL